MLDVYSIEKFKRSILILHLNRSLHHWFRFEFGAVLRTRWIHLWTDRGSGNHLQYSSTKHHAISWGRRHTCHPRATYICQPHYGMSLYLSPPGNLHMSASLWYVFIPVTPGQLTYVSLTAVHLSPLDNLHNYVSLTMVCLYTCHPLVTYVFIPVTPG